MSGSGVGGAMRPLSGLYGAVATARRRWYARHPEARRRLARPVVSIGNLRVGGSGKTPLCAWLARVLVEMGERPAILSRGYARRDARDGVVVVSDGRRMLADLPRAGDEPLMLARALDGVAVLVARERYLAGRLAEARFGCTVHVLDDGFQHVALERAVDLVLVSQEDVDEGRMLPAGRLREPLAAAAAADAVIVAAADDEIAAAVGFAAGHRQVFRAVRVSAPVTMIEPAGRVVEPAPGTRVLALAGIARPETFVRSLRESGWVVAGELFFRDHHPYAGRDIARVVAAAREAHAVLVVTTEKDLMRLLPLRPFPVPVAVLPYRLAIEPAAPFRTWLSGRLAGWREGRKAGARDKGGAAR